jgi:hypothetical protein
MRRLRLLLLLALVLISACESSDCGGPIGMGSSDCGAVFVSKTCGLNGCIYVYRCRNGREVRVEAANNSSQANQLACQECE